MKSSFNIHLNKENLKDKKRLFLIILSSFLISFAYLLFDSSKLFYRIFGEVSAEQILFHLQFPILGTTDYEIEIRFYKRLFVSVVIFIATFFTSIFLIKSVKFIKFQLLFAYIFLGASIVVVSTKYLPIYQIYKVAFNKVDKNYGTFYEDHYSDPKNIKIIAPDKKQNLIVIFTESMESTFSSKNIPTNISNMGGGIHHLAN